MREEEKIQPKYSSQNSLVQNPQQIGSLPEESKIEKGNAKDANERNKIDEQIFNE